MNPKTGKPLIPTIEQYKKLAGGMDISVQRLFELLDKDAPVDLRSSVVPPSDPSGIPDDEIRILIPGLSRLPPERVERTKNAFLAMFKATYPELFEKGDDDK
jgi:hypothetical protein